MLSTNLVHDELDDFHDLDPFGCHKKDMKSMRTKFLVSIKATHTLEGVERIDFLLRRMQ